MTARAAPPRDRDVTPSVLVAPPDERPCHTRDLRALAELAGVALSLPPARALPGFRAPADHEALTAWLAAEGQHVDAAIVSLDLVAHGGLVPSRLGDAPSSGLLQRLDAVRALRRARPDLPVAAAMVIQRFPDVDDATEEPPAWAEHGRRLHALGVAWHRAHRANEGRAACPDPNEGRAACPDPNEGRDACPDPDEGREACPDPNEHGVPRAVAHDVLQRRLRAHQANLAALELASEGVVEPLLLTSDDTAPEGLPRLERGWLEGWVQRLGLGERVHQHPGADEVASVLLARAVLGARGLAPRVAVRCAQPGGLSRVAPYEDRPVGETAAAQVWAAGARPTAVDGAPPPDLALLVHPPAAEGGDWALDPPSALDERAAAATADAVAAALDAGVPVALADCAHANGADPALVAALARRGLLGGLASFAGWNTAGNSLGSALAAGLLVGDERAGDVETARERLLVTRLAEDHAYQSRERSRLRARLAALGRSDPSPDGHADLCDDLASTLDAALAELGDPLLARWRVTDASIPWGRSFHVQATVEPAAVAGDGLGRRGG